MAINPGTGVARDLMIDLATSELVWIDGDLVLVRGIEAIKQDITISLRTHLGECFLDTSVGVPWLDRILGRGHSKDDIRGVLRRALLKVAGVVSVNKLDFDYSPSNRVLLVTWSVSTDLGAISGETGVETP
jgi:hypothetical protein